MNKVAAYLKYINEQILSVIEEGMKKKELTKYDAKEVASYTLDVVDKSNGPLDLLNALKAMAFSWPIFKNLVKAEEGKVARIKEENIAKNVAMLIKTENTRRALTIAKTAMKGK